MVRKAAVWVVCPQIKALPVGASAVAGDVERGRAVSQGQAQGLPTHAEAAALPAAAVLGDFAKLQLVQRNFRGVHLSRGICFCHFLNERTRFCTPDGRAGCSAGTSRPRTGWSRLPRCSCVASAPHGQKSHFGFSLGRRARTARFSFALQRHTLAKPWRPYLCRAKYSRVAGHGARQNPHHRRWGSPKRYLSQNTALMPHCP